MRALLTLDKTGQGKLLEKRSRYSRSFVQGLFDLLYTAQAQIAAAVPYSAVDIMGQARNIDSQAERPYIRNYKSTLQVISPSGGSGIFCPTGSYVGESTSEQMSIYRLYHFLKGDSLGIVVGAGSDPVAPDQRQIAEKIFHGRKGAVAATSSFDAYTGGDDMDLTFDSATDRTGLLMVPRRGFRLSAFRALLYRQGNPGNATLHIRGIYSDGSETANWAQAEASGIVSVVTDANTLPTGSPYEWREFAVSPAIDLHPGFVYSFFLEVPGADAANKVNWRADNLGYGNERPRFWYLSSSDGGATWYNTGNYIPLFETRGTALAELEYGGCDIFGLAIANPNGQFSIGRLFRNSSGETVTVSEVGLYAAATRYDYAASSSQPYARQPGNVYPLCIARDLVSPAINVLNGENLAVTYTPQITV